MESSLGEHSETLKLKTAYILQGQLQERMSVQHRLFWERENSLVQSATASKVHLKNRRENQNLLASINLKHHLN